jgi:hypothetical protein
VIQETIRGIAFVVVLTFVGCNHLRLYPERSWEEVGVGVVMGPPGAAWDTTYLLADGAAPVLSMHAAALEAHYDAHVDVLGVVWQPLRSAETQVLPDMYSTGGDSLLFTGQALATWTWRLRATGTGQERITNAMRGLWILTHTAGDGVLARCAFPVGREVEWGWPAAWASRAEFMGTSPLSLPDPILGGTLPATHYYTRATKDQLTGLVFGLSVAWAELDPVVFVHERDVIKMLVGHVYARLRHDNWTILDAQGNNDTTANDVDDLLRLAVLALARAVGLPGADEDYRSAFSDFVGWFGILGAADRYNNLEQYYAHSLRSMRSYGIWTLDSDPERRAVMVRYSEKHWRAWTAGHGNALFSWLWRAMSGEDDAGEGLSALTDLARKPTRLWSSPLAGRWEPPGFLAVTFGTTRHWALPPRLRKPTAYSTWQKEPWDAGDLPYDTTGLTETTGVDYLSAYWLGRALGFLP